MRLSAAACPLEPTETLRRYEAEGNFTARLGLMEELKSMPHGSVWDAYCARQNVPVGAVWLDAVTDYERRELSNRN